ncbi:MAG TPA: DNA double-strand break repair nuclease NurA, partial [Chloroflexota bacterium]
EDSVSLRRDLRERETLDQLSNGLPGNVLTFTDGPLELWSASGEETRELAMFREKYKGVLSRLQSRGAVTAGYVDKPRADLVVRLLELAKMSPEQLADRQFMRTYHPFRGVDDALLFSGQDQPWIFPGHRSAVFKLQSSSQNVYTGVLTLHFFYLNVGTTGHPWLVRVEIPQWVADDPVKLDLLHAVLVEQCEIMGYKPYPYLLHRAHETAVVRLDEKTQVEQMLNMELRRHGAPIGEKSPKQTAKDHVGRRSI